MLFAEIKIKFADAHFILHSLNTKDVNHKYSLEEKKHFNNNKDLILQGL